MTLGTQAHVHCSQLNTPITNTYPEVPGVGRGDTDGEDMAPNLDKHRVETLKFSVRSARIELSGDPEEGHLRLGCPEEGHFRAGMCRVLGTDQENNGRTILGEARRWVRSRDTRGLEVQQVAKSTWGLPGLSCDPAEGRGAL